MEENGPIELPIDGILDLHTFKPGDLGALLPDYLQECLDAGIYDVRIIHGKGTGALRQGVHAILERSPLVESFELAGDRSGWGATLARLRRPTDNGLRS